MRAQELREKFISFFEKKGHKRLPSVSLIPENDPSALFINSGMHPLVPYLLGQPHPEGRRLTSVQKCLRTNDIDKVDDPFHHTFFEMLGNWSLGDPEKPDGIGAGYFKKEAIEFSYEFLTKELKLIPKRLSVSVFAGDQDAPRDEEAASFWQAVGIPKERIYFFGKRENWWAVGETGPCGPDTEIFYDTGKKACGSKCQPGCPCGKYFEIWNLVFMIYSREQDGSLQKLKQKNVDTGMGLERTLSALNGFDDDYQTELFKPMIKTIEEFSQKLYQGENRKAMRIIADHLKAATFIIADGVEPSNKQQGYILRRLLRRSAVKMHQLRGGLTPDPAFEAICHQVIKIYEGEYFQEDESRELVSRIIDQEMDRFATALDRGLKELERASDDQLNALFAFNLFQTYGFPLEITEELFKQRSKRVDKKEFVNIYKKHQELSRKAFQRLFKGGLADHSEEVIKLHTATHLLHAALRQVLGPHVQQIGSNITRERLRFDFTHPKALSKEEIQKVEAWVSEIIKKNLKIEYGDMTLDEAKKTGALAFFGQRYPEKVKVYSIKDISKEVCAGPHVDFTGKLGEFIIKKEESVGEGKRRIYAVLEN